ncbi:MAG TPA: glycosyltransferase family 4 protein [Candidatus Obscuribacterales bacterium]
MRICLISREYPPDTGWGGIATFTRHLAHGLHELGHEVHVVSLAEGPPKTVDDEGVRVHRVAPYVVPGDLGAVAMCMPYSRYVLKTSSALWQKFIELHQQNPFDIVDTPELLAEGLYPAITKAAPLVIRLYTPHSKFMAEQLHNVTAKFDHQFVAMLERVAMLSADAITSPSEDLADFVSEDLNFPREQIQLIRNPIDPAAFTPEGPRALEETSNLRVLFVGRLEERKGITYLVQAIPGILEAYPDCEFVIIGADTINAEGGQRSVLNELRDFLARRRVIGKVKFISRIPLTELPSYYRSADICVVPSVYDNSPYTCLEAMACGRPVVGTSGGGTKEYVTHGECGIIVPPRDSEALQTAIVSLLKDNKARARMGQRARERVLEKFQRTHIAKETLALYEAAKRKFAARQNPLYIKPADQALSDAAVFLYSFDKMLYELLYQASWRFRIKHWYGQAITRPRLFGARVVLRIARAASTTFLPSSTPTPAFISWLEKEIADKHEQPFASISNRSHEQQ